MTGVDSRLRGNDMQGQDGPATQGQDALATRKKKPRAEARG